MQMRWMDTCKTIWKKKIQMMIQMMRPTIPTSRMKNNVEEMPNPASWNQDFSSAMTVNDGHDSAWLYHQNNIATGMYPNKVALQDAIINLTMSTKRVFRTKVSTQKYLTMVCTNMDCPSRVHAYLP